MNLNPAELSFHWIEAPSHNIVEPQELTVDKYAKVHRLAEMTIDLREDSDTIGGETWDFLHISRQPHGMEKPQYFEDRSQSGLQVNQSATDALRFCVAG